MAIPRIVIYIPKLVEDTRFNIIDCIEHFDILKYFNIQDFFDIVMDVN
jgi:hypothetical protein